VLNEFNLNFYSPQDPSLGRGSQIKVVPQDLSLLTPIAIAHWTAQRGIPQGGSLYICTKGFKLVDVQRLSQYLNERYKIKCTVHKRAGNYYIYILAKSLGNFKNIISPYKHNINYEYKTDNNLALTIQHVARS
jgi:hypothetical protein